MNIGKLLLHCASLVTIIVFIILAFGSDVDPDSAEYREAKQKLEEEGVIPTKEEMEKQDYWRENIVGTWFLRKDVEMVTGEVVHYQHKYLKSDDYVYIDQFKPNGELIHTSITDYSVKNEPNRKQITLGTYRIDERGYVQNLNGVVTYYHEIVELDEHMMIALQYGASFADGKYDEYQQQIKMYFDRADASPSAQANSHVVKKSETLYSIARTYGLTVDELKRLNGLTSNEISVGQNLIVRK